MLESREEVGAEGESDSHRWIKDEAEIEKQFDESNVLPGALARRAVKVEF